MNAIEFMARPAPTARRPLLGLTILLVEDSRFASEAVRLVAQRSGARLRRADCLAAARRHLGTYRPDVVIVDLGLPDGSGLELLAELACGRGCPDVLLATSGCDAAAAEAAARVAGADGFIAKPMDGVAEFQAAVLRHLPREDQPPGLRPVTADRVEPDRLALAEDLAHAARALSDARVPHAYVAAFLVGLARADRDAEMAERVAAFARRGGQEAGDALRALVERRAEGARAIP